MELSARISRKTHKKFTARTWLLTNIFRQFNTKSVFCVQLTSYEFISFRGISRKNSNPPHILAYSNHSLLINSHITCEWYEIKFYSSLKWEIIPLWRFETVLDRLATLLTLLDNLEPSTLPWDTSASVLFHNTHTYMIFI